MTANELATLEWLVAEVNRLRVEVAELRQLVAPATSVKTDAKSLRYRAKSAKCRTVAEVMAQRGSVSGCCNAHADNTGCSCLEMAQRYEAGIAFRCRVCKGHGRTWTMDKGSSESGHYGPRCERCKGTGKEPPQ